MKSIKQKIINLIYNDTVALSIFVLSISVIVFIISVWLKRPKYDNFVDGIQTELFGIIFDAAILVLLFNWINKKGEINRKRESYLNEIEDFSGWQAQEASNRILGAIKRLNRLNVYQISLNNCYIEKLVIKDLVFCKCDMVQVCFNNSTFYNTVFYEVYSSDFTCCDGKLFGVHFINERMALKLHRSYLNDILFENLQANGSIFQKTKVYSCLFIKVDLSYTNLEFEDCKLSEFIDCTFDEATVTQDWFAKMEDPAKSNFGIDHIKNTYDIIQVPNRGNSNSMKFILRRKGQTTPSKRPVHKVSSKFVYVINNPWHYKGMIDTLNRKYNNS